MKKKIVLIDYDVGNTGSLCQFFKKLGNSCVVSNSREIISNADVVVLPGVGAFPEAMFHLKNLYLIDIIKELADCGKPILGICLGMQLLFDSSNELFETKGLGIIPGRVTEIGKPKWHIGWNSIHRVSEDGVGRLVSGQQVFFNHSYQVICDQQYIRAVACHETDIVSVVQKKNIIGFQFHPEKSQTVGMELVKKSLETFAHA